MNSTIGIIQYGKDYSGQAADNSGVYVYAVSNDGCWNNCNFLYLGRVSIANMPNLSSADWSYWQGGDGLNSANWGAWATAMPLIQGTKKIGGASQPVYFGQLAEGCYVYINWFYPSVQAGTSLDASNSTWEIYTSVHPRASPAWTLIDTHTWTTEPGVGLYSPEYHVKVN